MVVDPAHFVSDIQITPCLIGVSRHLGTHFTFVVSESSCSNALGPEIPERCLVRKMSTCVLQYHKNHVHLQDQMLCYSQQLIKLWAMTTVLDRCSFEFSEVIVTWVLCETEGNLDPSPSHSYIYAVMSEGAHMLSVQGWRNPPR